MRRASVLPTTHPSVTRLLLQEFVQAVTSGRLNDVAQFEIVDRSALVAALLKNWRPIECCMINILAVKPRAGG